MRLNATRLGSIASSRSFGEQLYDLAGQVPSLDLQLATTKSLVNATTGQNLVTFTRASSATYVGSDGLIKTAVTNLLLRSEEFNDAYWTKARATVTANAAISPTGVLTADALIEDSTASNTHLAFSTSVSVATGTIYTYSIYAKATGRSWFNMQIGTGSEAYGATVPFCFFNVSNGTIGTSASCTATIQPVGDGWYRCILTAVATTAATTTNIRIKLADSSSSDSYTGNGTSGIFLWGAQIEQSSTVGEYIPTTSTINSAPRFDHNPTTGESLGLLVEESRTNLLLRSEEFDNASWVKLLATASANAISAPNGTTTADKLEETSGTGEHLVYQVRTGSNETVTLSVFCKQAERTRVRLGFSNFATEGIGAIYDLISGSVVSTSASGIDYTNPSASISAFGNGWFRCVFTVTKGIINTTNNPFVETVTGTSFSFAGTAGSGIYLWGAMLEAGAFPTSYISTTTATVTRAADVASITGSNFSSWYNQTEGTVFANATAAVAASILPCYASIDNGTTSERLQLRRTGSGANPSYRVVAGGQSIDSATKTIGSPAGFNSQTLAYASSNYEGACNGTLEGLISIVNRPTATQLQIGNGAGSAAINGHIRRLTYWPVRLANTTLQQITQP